MISLDCPYCATNFMVAAPTPDQEVSAFLAEWKAVASRQPVCTCANCHGSFRIDDDGDPDGSVMLHNVSRPRIDSLNVSAGPRTGGTAVTLLGQALHIGDLAVKFGGKDVTSITSRSEDMASVVIPPATYTLNIIQRAVKLSLTPTHSQLQLNEPVVTSAGSSGTLVLIESNYYVMFGSLVESFEDMVGSNLVGSTSGAVATIDAASQPTFEPGEFVIGLTSAAQGMLRTVSPTLVDAPSAGYASSELVRGVASDTICRLDATPYSGKVDVTVENKYGQREVGGTLQGAFTYA